MQGIWEYDRLLNEWLIEQLGNKSEEIVSEEVFSEEEILGEGNIAVVCISCGDTLEDSCEGEYCLICEIWIHDYK